MRQLFAEELTTAERQQQKPAEEDQKEVAKDETEEGKEADMEEVADDDGLGSPRMASTRRWRRRRWHRRRRWLWHRRRRDRRYVSGATVFWDQNSNFIMDANEAAYSTTTGADGSYSLNITSRPARLWSWTTVSISPPADRSG